MNELELEFLDDNQLAGFRLHQLEIFNWGTLHQKVWKMKLDGKTSLLTGDIGSGKSTIVDAITTLLVPAQRIAYNKAAGAESKERSLRSYVLGYYKSERDAETGLIKPAQLRDASHYSVILGVFYNEGFDQYISLAQVFWLKEQQQPARIFIGAEKQLSIVDDFSNFGSEMTSLRKKLRQNGVDVFDTFPPYSAWFRRRFGILHDQALELFHQTVSMKSVGNLTDFVRTHMLEPSFETEQRIDHLLNHFDDLNRAYQAVLKAQNQVALLTPIVADCQEYQQTEQKITAFQQSSEQLTPYFSELKLTLWQKQLQVLTDNLQIVDSQISHLEQSQRQQNQQRDEVKEAIRQNGGNRLHELEHQIKHQQQLKWQRKQKFEDYQRYIEPLDEFCVNNSADFVSQQVRLKQRQVELTQQLVDYENHEVEQKADLREIVQQLSNLGQDIESLKQRESNISRVQIEIRHQLCEALNLSSEQLPFVGELLKLKEEHKDWEGAAERLLHNFALSLIVPEQHYGRVAEWVNSHHLRGRLVYYRVAEQRLSFNQEILSNSLIHKLAIKPNTPYFDWLENELCKRFDFAACSDMTQFRREARAISLSGQIKDKSGRHEKDDRYRLDDRSRYVLGWSNKDKLAALIANEKQLNAQKAQLEQQIIHSKQQRQQLGSLSHLIVRLSEIKQFEEIDVEAPIKAISALESEKQALKQSSNILQQLQEKLEEIETQIQATHQALQQNALRKGGLEEEIKRANTELEMTALFVQETPINDDIRSKLAPVLAETLGKRSLTIENCDNIKEQIRQHFVQQSERLNKELRTLQNQIVKAMSNFKHQYPLETNEFEASVEGYYEYQELYTRLNADDLPRFLAQFKHLLNENTINEIANLNAQLNRERETTKQRIRQINQSLESIDYNPDRYISLELDINPDAEIRQFQQDLRACTEGSLLGVEDELYAENKFLQVKAIIDRFKGREGFSEADKRWAAKVTDVRNWFLFSATERWRTDHSEHENYPDSGGKSGGQKEKLAYTILAASLAYQFGLDVNIARSRTFRFVVIDEAFGRGSDESTEYGLRLFKQMNLQLLIVTPLQKIDIIEPYIANVCLVKNKEGAYSQLLNLTIEQHLAQKRAEREQENVDEYEND